MSDEWTKCSDEMPTLINGILMARRENGNEIKCYYHPDGMSWVRFYKPPYELSRFQCYETKDFLHDVTHWKPLKKKIKDEQG